MESSLEGRSREGENSPASDHDILFDQSINILSDIKLKFDNANTKQSIDESWMKSPEPISILDLLSKLLIFAISQT